METRARGQTPAGSVLGKNQQSQSPLAMKQKPLLKKSKFVEWCA